jgi:sulfite exporter TauE/SafE
LISLRKRPTAAPAEAGSAGRWNATSTRAGARLSGVLSLLGREPGLVGVGTAFLPCGALAGALVLAAGSSSAPTGGAVMLGFATTSGLGLLGVGWLAKRLRVHRRGVLVRVLAVVLTIGGIMLAIRPVDALRGQPAACCEAEGHG